MRIHQGLRRLLSDILSFCFVLRCRLTSEGKENSYMIYKSVILNCSIKIKGSRIRIIAKNCSFKNCHFHIQGKNHKITFGNNCKFRNTEFWIEDEGNSLTILDNCTCNGAHIALTENNSKIRIGQGCMFSSNIDIRNGDSHSIYDTLTGERINDTQDVIIGDRVWIGKGATVLKGVKIHDGSIVASKAVVTKEVPHSSIVAGNPGKVIRDNIRWNRARFRND